MYIIELFLKLKDDIKNAKIKKEVPKEKEMDKCSHVFLPVDSTGRILACSKCGQIYKLKKGEINPFNEKE